MARPTKYDLEKALDNAMELFWQRGYDSVSMADLVEFTGLSRSSMYSLFKDKEGLFKKSLENYNTKKAGKFLDVLKSAKGKKGIENLFDFMKFNENFRGCLFTNCMVEKDFKDSDIFDIPKNYFTQLQSQLEKKLIEASLANEFSGDVKTMTLILINMIYGFNLHGKCNQSEDDSNLMFEYILSLIK